MDSNKNSNKNPNMNPNFDSFAYENETLSGTATEVEQALRQLPVQQPSAALDQRVFESFESLAAEQRSLDTPHGSDESPTANRFVFTQWLPAAAAVAACAALVTLLILNSQSPNNGTINNGGMVIDFDPVRIEHVYSDIEPEGVIFIENDTPVQRYRRQTVEHVQLIDDARNIRIEMTVPKEDLIVMPVKYD